MSFEDDIAAAVDVFGVKAVGIVWGIGLTQWQDDDQRDKFLADMKGKQSG